MVGIKIKQHEKHTDVFIDKRYPISIVNIADFINNYELDLSVSLKAQLFRSNVYQITGNFPKRSLYDLHVYLHELVYRDYRMELIKLKQKIIKEQGYLKGIAIKVHETKTEIRIDKRYPISMNDIVDFSDQYKLNLTIKLENVQAKSYTYSIAGRLPKKSIENLYVHLYALINQDYRFELKRLKLKNRNNPDNTTPIALLNTITGYTGSLMDGTYKYF
jgi:hypothetical protein